MNIKKHALNILGFIVLIIMWGYLIKKHAYFYNLNKTLRKCENVSLKAKLLKKYWPPKKTTTLGLYQFSFKGRYYRFDDAYAEHFSIGDSIQIIICKDNPEVAKVVEPKK